MVIEGFAIDDFGLAGSLVVDRVGEGYVFVADRNHSLDIFADGDLGGFEIDSDTIIDWLHKRGEEVHP